MESITMTAEELDNVRRELHELESAGRSAIAARIKTAREWGDLKENGEYHAAKEEQAHLETRIARLREQVRNADGGRGRRVGDVVAHGSTVTWTDRSSGREQTFRIVSPMRPSPARARCRLSRRSRGRLSAIAGENGGGARRPRARASWRSSRSPKQPALDAVERRRRGPAEADPLAPPSVAPCARP